MERQKTSSSQNPPSLGEKSGVVNYASSSRVHAQLVAHTTFASKLSKLSSQTAPHRARVVVDLHAALELVRAAEEADVALGLRGAQREQPGRHRAVVLQARHAISQPKIVNSSNRAARAQ